MWVVPVMDKDGRPPARDGLNLMTEPPTRHAEDVATDADTWPWRCLRCGGTIFHDGERCRDCRTIDPSAAATASRPRGFIEWMRAEPLATFSLKVTATAGVELALTALWLELLLSRSAELARVVTLVGQWL